jgi:hypothetical protein
MKFLQDNGIDSETIRTLGEHGWQYRHLRTGQMKSNLRSHAPTTGEDSESASPTAKGV